MVVAPVAAPRLCVFIGQHPRTKVLVITHIFTSALRAMFCLVVIELSYVPRGYGKRSESGTEDAVEATSYHGEEVGI